MSFLVIQNFALTKFALARLHCNYLSSVDVLNVDNNQWSTGPSIVTLRQSMKSTTIGDTWYLMGGCYDSGNNGTDGCYISLETLASHSATDGSKHST